MERKVNVLLVDESRAVLGHLERMLSEVEGLAIVGMARNGAAAIRMTNESRPDLVLMELEMTGLDGLSALRTIKSQHPEVEVAMFSSPSVHAARVDEAFRLGACQVLGKPFDPGLIESVVEFVRQRLGPSHGSGRECA